LQLQSKWKQTLEDLLSNNERERMTAAGGEVIGVAEHFGGLICLIVKGCGIMIAISGIHTDVTLYC
jgi:hypothetical protein